MPKLSIVITTGIFPPDAGGPAHYVPRIARELTAMGHQVKVICLADDPNQPADAYPFSVTRIRRGLKKPVRALQTVAAIREALMGADLAYVNGLSFEAMIATRMTGVPSVHKIVGDYAWERAVRLAWFEGTIDAYQRAPKSPALWLLDWVRSAPVRAASAVIVPSAYLKGLVTGWGVPADRVRVVYNAVEPGGEFEVAAWPPFDGPTLLTVCRLVPWKGVDGLIDQLPDLPGVRLAVAGDGPMRSSLESHAVALGVAERVVFLGQVPRERIPATMARASAFVLNSTYEGLPHVALEAMEAGIPVVATSAGGTGELVVDRETGLLVPPGDAAALKVAIERVLQDAGLAAQLVASAKVRLAERFTHAAMVDETTRVLAAAARPER